MTLESIKHLATKDSIVAIASGDRGTEYYLLQVIGDRPEVLSIEETDDWGSTYPPGAEILRGYFLVRKRGGSSPYNYELVREKKTAIYAATIRYICPELCAPDTQAQPQSFRRLAYGYTGIVAWILGIGYCVIRYILRIYCIGVNNIGL